MSSPITQITINSAAISLADVEYAVYVNHGRSSISDGANASSASLTLIADSSTLPNVSIAHSLNIKAHGIDRFTGRITDIEIEHLVDGFARLRLQAIGKVSRLGTKFIENTSYPKEVAHSRALTMMIDSGEDYIVEGGYDIELKTKTIEYSSILDSLQKLANDIGAAIFDTPDGYIYIQFYDARGTQSYFEKFQDQGTLKWNSFGTETWLDQEQLSPTAGIPLALDANTVIFEPVWSTRSGNIINKVIIGYGSSGFYLNQNTTSQSQFGIRTLQLDTDIHDLTGATSRGGEILTRQAFPRWNLGSVEIYMDRITNTTKRDAIMNLLCGNRVQITDLPSPAPYQSWVGVVEGWGESFTGLGGDVGTHRITLALSDPLQSYAAMSWATLTTEQWNTINTSVIWADAIVPENLVP